MESKTLEIFEVGPCKDGFEMGFLIGKRFSTLIKSRLQNDKILQNQLLPFANSALSKPLLTSLFESNMKKYPKYWDELRGTAHGSDTPLLQIMLVNFRKEVLPFIPKADDSNDDCSDILVVSESMAFAAHNEDANVALVGHTYANGAILVLHLEFDQMLILVFSSSETNLYSGFWCSYLIKGILLNGASFTAYTYAGELPSCAFGFNSHGLAFTLNSVPPKKHEMAAGGIGRNFISRDLLEAKNIDDALARISSSEVSIGHSYNLIDINARRILNVETASRNRCSFHEVGSVPFFHANMYLHLKVQQEKDENSLSRQSRASLLPTESRSDFLSLLGDNNDTKYPIYMTGPLLHTLCTVVVDLDGKTLSIIKGNPKESVASFVFPMS